MEIALEDFQLLGISEATRGITTLLQRRTVGMLLLKTRTGLAQRRSRCFLGRALPRCQRFPR